MYECLNCLCKVCSAIKCPFHRPAFEPERRLDFCIRSLERGACPRVQCDFFVHQERKKYYKINKWKRREDAILDQLAELNKKIDRIKK